MPSDLACWVDLETTGGDPRTGHVLEFAAIITTADAAADVIAEYATVIAPARAADLVAELRAGVPASAVLQPEIASMHERNGLLDDVVAAPLRSTRDVDRDLTEWRLDVCRSAGAPRSKLLLAGSGVAHFETRWLPTHFPRFAGGLTYFTDTGVLRRSLRLAGVDVPDNGSRTHRALDDVRDHLTEWRTMAALVAP